MSRIALIRHGPTGWNQQKRLQGQSDQPLSDEGRARVKTWRLPEGLVDEFDWSPARSAGPRKPRGSWGSTRCPSRC